MSTIQLDPVEWIDDRLDEVIKGRRQEKVIGAPEVDVMSLLAIYLGHFVLTQRLGRVEIEMLFDMSRPDRSQFRPDLAYVSYRKYPRGKKLPPGKAFCVIPDIAIEVVSPSNTANEVEAKVVEYIDAGVPLVWVIHPTTERIYLHDSSSTVRVLNRADELVGGEMLPGFILPIAKIFEADEE